jgi:hypothetical protein
MHFADGLFGTRISNLEKEEVGETKNQKQERSKRRYNDGENIAKCREALRLATDSSDEVKAIHKDLLRILEDPSGLATFRIFRGSRSTAHLASEALPVSSFGELTESLPAVTDVRKFASHRVSPEAKVRERVSFFKQGSDAVVFHLACAACVDGMPGPAYCGIRTYLKTRRPGVGSGH